MINPVSTFLSANNPKRDLWLIALAGILAVNVAIGFHFYDVGKRKIALKATQDSLVIVQREKAIIAKQRDSVGKAFAHQDSASTKTRIVYNHDRANTTIVGDSAYDSTGHFIQVLDQRITERITSADTHVTQLEKELATAKYAFKIDTLFIAKTEQESGLHKSIADLTRGSRGSWGVQVGTGYCGTPKGGTPCVYVGVGYSVRF